MSLPHLWQRGGGRGGGGVQGFMFYSNSRGEQRKALHTGTHPAAVVRRFKIDPGTNGQQELSSSQRLVFISLNRPHIHHHVSTRSASAAASPQRLTPLFIIWKHWNYLIF